MPQVALSAHGTIIQRAPAATPTTFTTIGELGDITMPGLMRNEFDGTPHNRDIDTWVMGVLRREAITFPINFNTTDPSHDHLTGLYKAIIDNSYDGYKISMPAADTGVWVLSGFVRNIAPLAPVDGIQRANVTIRPSGPFTLNGVVIGAAIAP